MINLDLQILEHPYDEFEQVKSIAEKVKENIDSIQSETTADVFITLMSNRHFNVKIDSPDKELKRLILIALDPIFSY